MDHKNKKGPQKKAASIDGFVSNNPQIGLKSNHSYQPNRGQATPSLGSYVGSSDGFHTQKATPYGVGHAGEMAEAEALLDEPIILDDIEEDRKKKHYFGSKHPRLRKFTKRAGMTLMALILIGVAFFGAKFYMTQKNLLRGGGKAPALADLVDINKLKGEGDGRVNILLLGIGGPNHEGGDLSDTVMVASIDPVNNKAALLSLPRDLWVKIPGDGSQKLNAAYAYGKQGSRAKTAAGKSQDGIDLADKTLENVLGIPIHYHAVVDFTAFQHVVDAVGGVDANVPAELSAKETFWVEGTSHFYTLNVPAGQQHFDGTRALYFARERHVDSDFVRSQRQRLILTALKEKIFSAGTFSNPVKISNLMSSLGSSVYTDFSRQDISRLYKISGKIQSKNVASIDLVTAPHAYLTTGDIDGLSVVEPKTGLYDYTDIKAYVRNALRDSFIAKENASIAVYNATDVAGLATSKATYLKSYGYSITTVTNTPIVSNPATTTVVDLSKGVDKYTRHYLEGRFGVTARTTMPTAAGFTPPSGTSFVIILGTDAANSV